MPEDGAGIDAVELDARPVRTGPLVTSGQAADLVLGQPSFGTNLDRGVTAQSFTPDSVAFDAGRLWISDSTRNRVLGWDEPASSNAPATYVLGQSSFTASTATAISASSLVDPRGVIAAGGRMAVLDYAHHRAMVWTSQPSSPGESAALVLGQTSFAGSTGGFGPAELRWPVTGTSDGRALIIRAAAVVWIWSSWPASNGAPADLQLHGGAGPTASQFMAGSLHVDGDRLVMSDSANNRVLIWNTIPTADGQPADLVLGQPDFVSNAAASSASGMNQPSGVTVIDGALFVADTGNDRVLVFDPVPTTSGASATQVLGQSSPSFSVTDSTPSDATLNEPVALATANRTLFVADRGNRRVLRYDLTLP